MKASTRKLILFSSCMAFVGVVLLGAGMLLGGRPGIIWNREGIHSPYSKNKPYVLEKTKVDAFSDVDIQIGSYADIQILPSDDEQFYLEYELDGNYGKPSYDVRKDSLTLTHTGEGPRYGINFFYFGSDFPNANVKAYVRLYIPEDEDMGSLHVYNDSGDLSIDSLAFGDTKLEVSYGNLKLQDISFQNLEIDMESGDFKAENLTAQDMTLKNEYGDITLEKASAQEAVVTLESGAMKADQLTSASLTVKSEYGNVTLDEFSTKTAGFSMESGDLRLDALELTDLSCKNDYGNVRIRLPKDISEYSVNARSEYGSIDLPKDAPGSHIAYDDEAVYKSEGKSKGSITIEVESGDITIE